MNELQKLLDVQRRLEAFEQLERRRKPRRELGQMRLTTTRGSSVNIE